MQLVVLSSWRLYQNFTVVVSYLKAILHQQELMAFEAGSTLFRLPSLSPLQFLPRKLVTLWCALADLRVSVAQDIATLLVARGLAGISGSAFLSVTGGMSFSRSSRNPADQST